MKPCSILALLAVLSLSACAAGNPTKSTERPTDVAVNKMQDSTVAAQQLAKAGQLVADKNWPQAIKALRTIIEARSFSSLPSEIQYRVLVSAGSAALYHGPPTLAYGYLVRVVSMPRADFDDWSRRLQAADKLGYKADSVSTLTVLIRRWPDRSKQFNADYILNVINEATRLSRGAALPLLQALYDEHWKLKWDIEPSATWRDLTLLLLERGRLREATDVSAHISDVYVLIAMRADRRFDAVVAANPAQFDIDAAAEREFQDFQAAAESMPRSLKLKSQVIEALLHQQHYEGALAASDAILLDIRSTNYPRKLYEDYDEESPWFITLRSISLERVGRREEAVAQLSGASPLFESREGNVNQLIDLGGLYCALGRPSDALAAIGRVVAGTSPYGAMRMEVVRLEAAVQLGDTKQIERSLQFLRAHRADAPSVYEYASIIVNQSDRAAHELMLQLHDQDQRQEALLSVQTYAPTPGTLRELDLEARWRAVIARKDVQAAIQKVGRTESYRLEEPL